MADKPTNANAKLVVVESVTVEAPAAPEPARKATPDCPHCGATLKAHGDTEGYLHCYSLACGGAKSGCCFAHGARGPQLRSNSPGCPALGR